MEETVQKSKRQLARELAITEYCEIREIPECCVAVVNDEISEFTIAVLEDVRCNKYWKSTLETCKYSKFYDKV